MIPLSLEMVAKKGEKSMKNGEIFITQNEIIRYEEFAFYLRSMRRSVNLTQEEMASALGCSKSIYKLYEMGERAPIDTYDFLYSFRKVIKEAGAITSARKRDIKKA